MIRIDLRYVTPIVAFYTPALMLLALGWMVGYSITEMREAVVTFGGVAGSISALATALFYIGEADGPRWFYIRGKGADE